MPLRGKRRQSMTARLLQKRLLTREKRANESQEMRMKRLSQERERVAERRAKEQLEDRLYRLSRMRQQVAKKRLKEKQMRQQVARERLKEKQKQQELRLPQDAKSRASQNYAACIIPTDQGNDNAVLRGKRRRGVEEKQSLGDKGMEHYVCSLCDISFEDISTLYLHMRIHVDRIGSESSYCSITPKSSIVSRRKDSDDQREYWCNICCKRFRNFPFFTRHMQAHREGKTFRCKICVRIFTSKSSLYNHICNHVRKACKCTSGHRASQRKDDQPKIFESADDLHLCSICYMGFDTKNQIENHMRKHSVYLRCSLASSSYESQIEHDEQVEGHAHVQCEICFEMFPDKEERDDHMETHSHSHPQKVVMNGQRDIPITSLNNVKFVNYSADDLGEIISKKLKEKLEKTNGELVSVSGIVVGSKTVGSLVSRDSISGKTRNFLCDALKVVDVSRGRVVDGYEGKQSNSEYRNILNTSGVPDMGINADMPNEEYSETVTDAGNNHIIKYVRKYECKLCFSVWTNKRFFWQHLLGHSEKVPYTCKICAEIFNEKSWKIHKASKCKCAVCGKLIKGRGESTHPKTCRIGNPFTCTLCVERFPSPEVFSDHMKTHYSEKFACKCGKKFCRHEIDIQEEMHRKENKDPSTVRTTLSPTENEDDFLSDTSSLEILSQISDEESNVKMSSGNTESGFDFIKLGPIIVVNEESACEDSRFLNRSGAATDVEQSNLIVMTDEIDSYIPDESAIDPLA